MKNVLVVCGHPDLAHSVANKAIVEELQKLLPTAEFDFLGDLYPEYKIDVKKEQAKLLKADVIVLQFPVFWYNAPSLLRKWFEDVLTFGFAYGVDKTVLAGKKLICSLSTGSPTEAYRHGGAQQYTMDEYLVGIKQLVLLCGMEWNGCIQTGGVSYETREDETVRKDMVEKCVRHARELVRKIENL